MDGGWCGRGGIGVDWLVVLVEGDGSGAGDIGDEGEGDRVWRDIGNGGNGDDVTGFDAGFGGFFYLEGSERDAGSYGNEDNDRKENCKDTLDGDAPDLVVGDLGFLGLFELNEFSFGKVVTMPFGAAVDVETFAD